MKVKEPLALTLKFVENRPKTVTKNNKTLNFLTPLGDNSVKFYQGDSLKFLSSLPNESVDVIVTDPAYSGMNEKMKFGNGRIVGEYGKEGNGKWFPEFKDDPDNFLRFLRECYRVLKNDRHIYIMFDSFSLLSLGPLMREVFNVKNIITWDKINIGMGHYFRRRHEFVLFATKGHKKLNSQKFPDVWQVKRIHKSKYPTQKPVEIFDIMLKASAQKNYTICDPFMGSGTAIIASLKNSCKFIGSDISEKACTIAAQRVKEYMIKGIDPLEKAGKHS